MLKGFAGCGALAACFEAASEATIEAAAEATAAALLAAPLGLDAVVLVECCCNEFVEATSGKAALAEGTVEAEEAAEAVVETAAVVVAAAVDAALLVETLADLLPRRRGFHPFSRRNLCYLPGGANSPDTFPGLKIPSSYLHGVGCV